MAHDRDTFRRTEFSNEGAVPLEGASGRSFDLRLLYEQGKLLQCGG
jgi:hypothetical protein